MTLAQLAIFEGKKIRLTVESESQHTSVWHGVLCLDGGLPSMKEEHFGEGKQRVYFNPARIIRILVDEPEETAAPLSEKWPFPWPEPQSAYDTNGPQKTTVVHLSGADYVVGATGESGLTTGRDLFRVECFTCGEVLHSNTTSPSSRILLHHKEKHQPPTPNLSEEAKAPPAEEKPGACCIDCVWRFPTRLVPSGCFQCSVCKKSWKLALDR